MCARVSRFPSSAFACSPANPGAADGSVPLFCQSQPDCFGDAAADASAVLFEVAVELGDAALVPLDVVGCEGRDNGVADSEVRVHIPAAHPSGVCGLGSQDPRADDEQEVVDLMLVVGALVQAAGRGYIERRT